MSKRVDESRPQYIPVERWEKISRKGGKEENFSRKGGNKVERNTYPSKDGKKYKKKVVKYEKNV